MNFIFKVNILVPHSSIREFVYFMLYFLTFLEFWNFRKVIVIME